MGIALAILLSFQSCGGFLSGVGAVDASSGNGSQSQAPILPNVWTLMAVGTWTAISDCSSVSGFAPGAACSGQTCTVPTATAAMTQMYICEPGPSLTPVNPAIQCSLIN